MGGQRAGGQLPGRLLHEPIDHVAASDPASPALYFQDRIITFAELSAHTRRVAAGVARRTAAGDRVAMVGENHPSWIEAYYGVPRARRILVFLNHRLAAAELASIVARSGSTMVVGPTAEIDRLRPLVDGGTTLMDLTGWEAMLAEDGSVGEQPDGDPEDAIWVIFTSGTTGSPKGATLTHRTCAASLEASAYGRPIGPDDVFLYPFPLCHVSGYNVLRNLAVGRPVVLMERFAPADFLALVARHRATKTTITATMLSSLLDHLDAHPETRPQLASLAVIAYGAAPMPPTLLRRAYDELGIDFTQGYGMTELAGNAVFLSAEDHRRALAGADHLLRAAGRPAPNVEVRVIDDDGRPVSPGISGEIVVRGDQVMTGYWDDEETTEAAFSGHWFHTGDVGVVDDDGILSVVDRKKDVIVTGAENVSSREVEDAILRTCPEVREVAVVGVPDPHWGENVCAVVVLGPDAVLPPEVLITRVRGHLAGFKAPRHVVEIAELPRNTLGKVIKSDLRQWLADRPALIGARRGRSDIKDLT